MTKIVKKIASVGTAIVMSFSMLSMGASASTYRGYTVEGSSGGFKYCGSSSYVGTFHNRITKEGLFIITENGTAGNNSTTCKVSNITYVIKNRSTGNTANRTLENKSGTNTVRKTRIFSSTQMNTHLIASSKSTHIAHNTTIISGVATKYGSHTAYNNL